MPTLLRQRLLLADASEPIDMNSEALKTMDVDQSSSQQLEHLVQWSDLIIFDYLTGNYDRVASMQV